MILYQLVNLGREHSFEYLIGDAEYQKLQKLKTSPTNSSADDTKPSQDKEKTSNGLSEESNGYSDETIILKEINNSHETIVGKEKEQCYADSLEEDKMQRLQIVSAVETVPDVLLNFFTFCSYLLPDIKDTRSSYYSKLCMQILLRLSEDKLVNHLIHEPKLIASLPIYHKVSHSFSQHTTINK